MFWLHREALEFYKVVSPMPFSVKNAFFCTTLVPCRDSRPTSPQAETKPLDQAARVTFLYLPTYLQNLYLFLNLHS
jgi:hypothetical protein